MSLKGPKKHVENDFKSTGRLHVVGLYHGG